MHKLFKCRTYWFNLYIFVNLRNLDYTFKSVHVSSESTSLSYFLFQPRLACHFTKCWTSLSSSLSNKSAFVSLHSSSHGDSGLSASSHPQPGDFMAGRRKSSSLGSPPQRLGRQSLQQAEPAPPRLRVPRRPLRRLPVRQQLKHGLRILLIAAFPLQSPSVHFPPYTTKGRITGPGGRVSLRHQDGREGIYQIPSVVNGRDEDGGLQSAKEQPGLHELSHPLHPPSHTDISHLLSPNGARVRQQSVSPRQPAGSIIQLQPQEQRQDTVLHRWVHRNTPQISPKIK